MQYLFKPWLYGLSVWEPKSGRGRASAIITLAALRGAGLVSLRRAVAIATEKRAALDLSEQPRMIRNHVHYLLKAGLLEPEVVCGSIYVKVSRKGEELLRSIFSG